MIVVCSSCLAKFRIPDEKVGPRGAKVRCSRCATVFLVRPDGTAAAEGAPLAPPAAGGSTERPRSALDVDLEPAPAAAASFGMTDPFSTGALALSAAPSAPAAESSPAALQSFPPPLPGTSASPSPWPSPAVPPAADDLGLFLPGTAEGLDRGEAGGPPADPGDPAGGGSSPGSLPLTDLSDLLGPATPPAVPLPDATGAGEAIPVASPDAGGLSLEERLTPLPFSVGGAAGELFVEPDAMLPGLDAAPPAFAAAAAGDAFAPAASSTFGQMYEGEPLPGDEALALAGEAEPELPSEEASREPSASEFEPHQPAAHAAERVHRRRLPLRSIAANAIALAALLAIAVAMLAVWRSEGPFEIAMLRPASLLAALRTDAPPAPFAAVDLRTGLYEREKAPPIIFVRGRIVSRAQEAVRGVRVAVEVVRGGEVIARGAALAGAVPTAEELWTAPDASALERVERVAEARVPSTVRPGDRVPFLVAIAEHPSDLQGATLRVALSPAEGRAP